jgi:hypothetical protein
MKNITRIRLGTRWSTACLLVGLLAEPTVAQDPAKKSETGKSLEKPAATTSAQLARDMTGTWVLVGKPGKVRETPEAGGRLKFRTGAHWTMTQSDPKTGLVVMHDGGTYSLDGDTYMETIEYANDSTSNDIGRTFIFKVKVEGDFMTQEGVGNPYTEVWKRLK